MSSPTETLQGYFDSLLGGEGLEALDAANISTPKPTSLSQPTDDPVSEYAEKGIGSSRALANVAHNITSAVTSQLGPSEVTGAFGFVDPNQFEPHSPAAKPTSRSDPVERLDQDRVQSTGRNPFPIPRPKSALSEPKKQLKDEYALLAEQKRKLQTLLSPQALTAEVTAEPSLAVTTKTQTQVKLNEGSEEKTEVDAKLEPVAGVELNRSVVDVPLSEYVETDLVEEASSVDHYDSFHSELCHEVEWADNGRPKWAQSRFDALLFDVSGLTLAVPLVALGQIVSLKNDITPIFGQAEWFMGILATTLGKLKVVNTALFVMPEKYNEAFLDSAEYAISLDGVPWALAVDKVTQPVSLDPEEIKWRGQRSKRPWLAGTVKSSMCALIDIPHMAKLLYESDKNTRAAR